MKTIPTIYSLRDVLNLLKKHKEKEKVMVWFDIDLTLIYPDPNDEDVDILIEPKETKELFSYISENNIAFSIITARFYDSVCNSKKRNLNLMKHDILNNIFPFLEQLGLNLDDYKERDEYDLIKSETGRCVGMVYKGILFGSNKGKIIKIYREKWGLDKTHPVTIFVDDYDTYLNSVAKHIPDSIVLRREIYE